MVSTEHIESAIKSSLAFIEVIGDVSGNVRSFSVRFDNNSIFFIAEG
jgi:hypothetical protein